MRSTFVKLSVAFILAFSLTIFYAIAAFSQGKGAIKGKIINGTTGKTGKADSVVLMRLQGGMESVGSLFDVADTFTFENLEVGPQALYLLQADFDGVTYTKTVNVTSGGVTDAEVVVYDATPSPDQISVSLPHLIIQRDRDILRIDRIFEVRNQGKKSYIGDENGTFKFYLPDNYMQLNSLTASTGSMPVNQEYFPLDEKNCYAIEYPMKPDTTTINISYNVDYATSKYDFREVLFYEMDDIGIFVVPADLKVSGDHLEIEGVDRDRNFTFYKVRHLDAGQPLAISLSGGSSVASTTSPSGRVTKVPNEVASYKWLFLICMGLVLTGMLLLSNYGGDKQTKKHSAGKARKVGKSSKRKDALLSSIAALDNRFEAGEIKETEYDTQRKELKDQLIKIWKV